MQPQAIAVKAFIVNDKEELLLIRREDKDVHAAGAWEIPGGRLEPGEDPFEGLKREVMEETGIRIEIGPPMRVYQFTRDDGLKILMLVFLCKPLTHAVRLSPEHTDFCWAKEAEWERKLVKSFHPLLDIYKKIK